MAHDSEMDISREHLAYSVMTLEQHHASQQRWVQFEQERFELSQRTLQRATTSDALGEVYGGNTMQIEEFITKLQDLQNLAEKVEVDITPLGYPVFSITFKRKEDLVRLLAASEKRRV